MLYKFKCSDVGFNCPYVAEGNSEQEVIDKARQHGKKAHGFTEEQLNNSEMTKKVKAAIKQT
jgi:predicted small metal-binding protein